MDRIGLVLQGGGALGAFEWGVIERLLEVDMMPHVVSGISIGAVNAALLCGAKRLSADERRDRLFALRGAWQCFTTFSIPGAPSSLNEFIANFGNPGIYFPRWDYYDLWRWTYIWDTTPILGTLETYIDFSRLRPGGSGTQLILAATNVETGEQDLFDSRKMQITADHIRAAISIPPNFPAVTIPDESDPEKTSTYWDGGLFNNTLFDPVRNALWSAQHPDASNLIYVVELFPNRGTIPKTMPEVLGRMLDIIFANKTRLSVQQERARNAMRIMARTLHSLNLPTDQMPFDGTFRTLLEEPLTEIYEINKQPSEGYGAWNDFSHDAIERRRRAGYQAACNYAPPPKVS